MADLKEARSRLKHRLADYDYIRFVMSDIQGCSRSKLIPARNAHKFLENGTGIFSGLISAGPRTEDWAAPCILEANFPNAQMVPDPNTLYPCTWVGEGKRKTGMLLCETLWSDGSPQKAHPRYVARRQLEALAEHGLSIMSAFELEFMMIENDSHKPLFGGPDYGCTLVMSHFEDFFMEFDEHMAAMGVNMEGIHTEHAPGQFETILTPEYGIQAADYSFILKQTLKELAEKKGWQANFMAKMNPDLAGSGTHFNFSIWSKETGLNAFYDAKGKDGLSDLARYWIGGLTKHFPAISALSAPTVNCYRRFHQPWAPDVSDWGIDDRTVSLRVKNHGPSSTYMENRVPSGLCNPYLVLAATIAAGIDGMENKIEPAAPGPKGATRLPDNLAEALDALEADKAMVKALGEEFCEWFISSKRNIELKVLSDSDPKVSDVESLAKEFHEYAQFI